MLRAYLSIFKEASTECHKELVKTKKIRIKKLALLHDYSNPFIMTPPKMFFISFLQTKVVIYAILQ